MWYFTWILGVGFAVLLAILNAMWGENEEARRLALAPAKNKSGDKPADKRYGRSTDR